MAYMINEAFNSVPYAKFSFKISNMKNVTAMHLNINNWKFDFLGKKINENQ